MWWVCWLVGFAVGVALVIFLMLCACIMAVSPPRRRRVNPNRYDVPRRSRF